MQPWRFKVSNFDGIVKSLISCVISNEREKSSSENVLKNIRFLPEFTLSIVNVVEMTYLKNPIFYESLILQWQFYGEQGYEDLRYNAT